MSFLPFIIYIIKLTDFCNSLFYINFDFCWNRDFECWYILTYQWAFIKKQKNSVSLPPAKEENKGKENARNSIQITQMRL